MAPGKERPASPGAGAAAAAELARAPPATTAAGSGGGAQLWNKVVHSRKERRAPLPGTGSRAAAAAPQRQPRPAAPPPPPPQERQRAPRAPAPEPRPAAAAARAAPRSRSLRRLQPQPFRTFLCLDFEATCERDAVGYPHEIIEFPCVAVCSSTLRVISTFHTYVRPVINPQLSPFCQELTGISQEQVDGAPTLAEAVPLFEQWLQEEVVGVQSAEGADGASCCIATDGPWDLRDFLWGHSVRQQGKLRPEDLGPHWRRWLDVRSFCARSLKGRSGGIKTMLQKLGLTFQGRPHCGMDDTRNVAEILRTLLQRGHCAEDSIVPLEKAGPTRAVVPAAGDAPAVSPAPAAASEQPPAAGAGSAAAEGGAPRRGAPRREQ